MRSLYLAILLLSLGILGCGASSAPTVGDLAPEIEGEDIDGVKFRLSDFKGKVVLLDFSAEWCGPCRSFYPRGRELVSKFQDRPFVLVGVNINQDRAAAKKSMNPKEVTWRSWWDGSNGPIARRWGVQSIPTIYLIDTKGVIRQVFLGPQAQIEYRVDMLVKQAEQQKI